METTKDYIQLNLSESNWDGYGIVEHLIWNYFDHNFMDDLVVRLSLSYDGDNYDVRNEITFFDDGRIEFLNDWWEGQKFIRIYGIQSVPDLDVSGGLYPD